MCVAWSRLSAQLQYGNMAAPLCLPVEAECVEAKRAKCDTNIDSRKCREEIWFSVFYEQVSIRRFL